MQQNIEAILGTIGQKFDMSFDQSDNHQQNQCIEKQSANPQIFNSNNKTQNAIQNSEQDIEEIAEHNKNQQEVNDFNQTQPNQQDNNQYQPQRLSRQNQDDNKIIGKIGSQDKFCSEIGQTVELFQSQQEQKEYYKSLNLKFQMALNKISHKSLHNTSRVQEGFIQRVEYYQRQKNSDLNQLKRQKQERENMKLKFKPLINSKSVQMLNHYKPIEYRYNDVIRQKHKKIERQKQQKLEKIQEKRVQQQRYIQEYQQKLKQKYGSMRTKEQYYNDQQHWLQRKQKHLQSKKQMKQQQLQSQITFQPEINKKSNNMMKKKKDRVIIYQKQPQIKPKLKDPNCTFKPNLNKTIKS